MHLWYYSYDGNGIKVMEIFATLFSLIADVSTSINILMIASGWTLTYLEMDWDNLDIYVPMGAAVTAIHLVAGSLIFIDDEAHHKFHDFAGYQGWALIFIKLITFAYFLYVANDTRGQFARGHLDFFNKFCVFAGIYLLSLPLSIIVSLMYAP
jgi:hypothetical protein